MLLKNRCTFFLGIHRPTWASSSMGPTFISIRQIRTRRTRSRYDPASHPYAIDSGGFTELNRSGRWETSAKDYVGDVARSCDEFGTPQFAASQDWMCEDAALKATGLSVEEHQRRSVDSVLELRDLSNCAYWLPVLQGREPEDYLRHVDLYLKAGIDLTCLPRVGIGSVCRRSSSHEIRRVVSVLADAGIRLHGFGVKTTGLALISDQLESADSMAWSYAGRKRGFKGAQNSQRVAEAYRVFMDAVIDGDPHLARAHFERTLKNA